MPVSSDLSILLNKWNVYFYSDSFLSLPFYLIQAKTWHIRWITLAIATPHSSFNRTPIYHWKQFIPRSFQCLRDNLVQAFPTVLPIFSTKRQLHFSEGVLDYVSKEKILVFKAWQPSSYTHSPLSLQNREDSILVMVHFPLFFRSCYVHKICPTTEKWLPQNILYPEQKGCQTLFSSCPVIFLAACCDVPASGLWHLSVSLVTDASPAGQPQRRGFAYHAAEPHGGNWNMPSLAWAHTEDAESSRVCCLQDGALHLGAGSSVMELSVCRADFQQNCHSRFASWSCFHGGDTEGMSQQALKTANECSKQLYRRTLLLFSVLLLYLPEYFWLCLDNRKDNDMQIYSWHWIRHHWEQVL